MISWLVGALLSAALLAAGIVAVQHVRHTIPTYALDKPDGSLRLASWNVHYIVLNQPEGPWGLSGWERRKTAMSTVFGDLDADIVAFQEMESFARGSDGSINLARDWLLAQHPEYAAAAKGPWQEFPPTQPIFYRPKVLELRDEGWFFFSKTPERIYSRGFDGGFASFASWAEFSDRETGAIFRVVNVHPDAKSRVNRRASAALIAERIRPWIDQGQTVLVAGDLNARHGAFTQRTIASAGLVFPRSQGATFHFNRGLHLFAAIDHIGISRAVRPVGEPRVLQRSVEDVYPSDHHPVFLDFQI